MTILWIGSVELTRSAGGMRGVSLVQDSSMMDVSVGRSVDSITSSSALVSEFSEISSSSG